MAKMNATVQQSSVASVLSQSVAVLTNPQATNLEEQEQRGTLAQASLYVGVVALIAGLLNFPLGIVGVLGGFLNTLVGFFFFTGLVYAIGQSEGHRAPFGAVAYAFSLFIAPLSLILPIATFIVLYPSLGLANQLIPILAGVALLVLVIQSYFAYVVMQKPGLNVVDNANMTVALVGAVIGTWFAQMVIATVGAGWVLVVAPY
jgi:hypothetical protein